MKIYLAGKMDEEHGQWRDAILGQEYRYEARRYVPRWEIVRDGDLLDYQTPPVWPSKPNSHVLGLHDYVGPYRLSYAQDWDSKYGGYFHGQAVLGQHGVADQEEQRAIVAANCHQAIIHSDIVFAFLNYPDCFGTLAEIGMAKALGKYVYVACDDDAEWDWGDYWFIEALADDFGQGWTIWRHDKPKTQKDRALAYFRDALIRWSARPATPPTMALVARQDNQAKWDFAREVAQSFSQIARWSADPRVREEAQKMLRRIPG